MTPSGRTDGGGKQFAIIGGGTMGEAFTRALLANDLARASAVCVCEINETRRRQLQDQLGVQGTDSASAAAESAPVVVLAVKPQDFATVGGTLQGLVLPEQLVLSIMAGVRMSTLRDTLGHRALVRAMPNTPAQIGEGYTVWTASAEVTAAQQALVRRMLATMGTELMVPDEQHVDIATAVSGSGPGFFFLFLEAMIDGAVQIGLRRELATEMVYQTALGSAALARQSGKHPAALRDMVTSPGGTTAEGLLAMERQGVRAGTIEAILAAYRRAQVLGQ